MKSIRPQVGGIATGLSFFGREKDLEIFGEKVLEGKNILFSGPRRTGKSSLILEYIEGYKGGRKLIYIDLEKCTNIEEFSKAIIKELKGYTVLLEKGKDKAISGWNTVATMIKELDIEGFAFKTGEIKKSERKILEKLSDILGKATKENCIFFFDEFADFIWCLAKGESDLEYFLKWFQEMRKGGRIQVVITGSVNIAPTIDKLKMNYLLIDPEPFHLIPLNETKICELFQGLLKYRDIAITGPALDFAMSKVKDGHLYFVQVFADFIYTRRKKSDVLNDVSEIEKIYDKLTNSDSPALSHFHSRLEMYVQEYFKECHTLLAHLSINSLGKEALYPYVSETIDKKTMNQLLSRLSDEGYIVIENNNCRFVSKLLADWWRNKYEYER